MDVNKEKIKDFKKKNKREFDTYINEEKRCIGKNDKNKKTITEKVLERSKGRIKVKETW